MDTPRLFSTLMICKKKGIDHKYSIFFAKAFSKNATTRVYHLYPHMQPQN